MRMWYSSEMEYTANQYSSCAHNSVLHTVIQKASMHYITALYNCIVTYDTLLFLLYLLTSFLLDDVEVVFFPFQEEEILKWSFGYDLTTRWFACPFHMKIGAYHALLFLYFLLSWVNPVYCSHMFLTYKKTHISEHPALSFHRTELWQFSFSRSSFHIVIRRKAYCLTQLCLSPLWFAEPEMSRVMWARQVPESREYRSICIPAKWPSTCQYPARRAEREEKSCRVKKARPHGSPFECLTPNVWKQLFVNSCCLNDPNVSLEAQNVLSRRVQSVCISLKSLYSGVPVGAVAAAVTRRQPPRGVRWHAWGF